MNKYRLYVSRLLLFMMGLTSVIMTMGCPNSASSKGKTLNVVYTLDRFDITIENKNSMEAAGATVDVYLNEGPPGGFKHEIEFPAFGRTVTLHLDTFAKADGTKFNPNTPITDIWIGGGHYAYDHQTR